ncbi:MAG: cytidylate kinase-like family protein [Chloroflexi bacterium]|nr:cytidylate kinase-like family protein [Chloroflexota bacterium]
MPVVTVVGQYGSEAADLGREVAQILGVDYVDREILVAAAQKLGTSVEAVEKRDERPTTLGERLSGLLQAFLEKSAAAGSAGDPFLEPTGLEILLSRSYGEMGQPLASAEQAVDDVRCLQACQSIIRELAATGRVVIMGRASNIILRDYPRSLHVRVVAPMADRIRRTMSAEGLSQGAAQRLIQKRAEERMAYYRKFYGVDVNDPDYYDMVVNLGKQPMPFASRVIAYAAKQLELHVTD